MGGRKVEQPVRESSRAADPRVLRPTPRAATAPGVEFVYETFIAKIASQIQSLEQMDVKLGVVTAILGSAAAGSLAAQTQGATAIALLLLAPITIAVLGLRVRKIRNDPDPLLMVNYAGDEPGFVKQLTIPSLMKAFTVNQADLQSKAWHLNGCAT